MLSIISPSKTQDLNCRSFAHPTIPVFLPETRVLADHMKTLSEQELSFHRERICVSPRPFK